MFRGSRARFGTISMKLLVFSDKTKAYDVLSSFTWETVRKIQEDGLIYKPVWDETVTESDMRRKGYERAKYY